MMMSERRVFKNEDGSIGFAGRLRAEVTSPRHVIAVLKAAWMLHRSARLPFIRDAFRVSFRELLGHETPWA